MGLAAIVLVAWCAPVAGNCCVEDAWICYGVYDINVSHRAAIDDYTVKLREIENGSAVLVLYQRNQFKDIYTMSESDTEIYFNRFRITLLRLEDESVTIKAYKYGKERLWGKEGAVELAIGENASTGEYLISVIDFENESVNLSIYRNGARSTHPINLTNLTNLPDLPDLTNLTNLTHLACDKFDVRDSHVYDGELKVYLRYLCDDYCIIETYLPLSPDLVINITTDDVYQPDQMIHCPIGFKNSGLPVRDFYIEVKATNGQEFSTYYPVIDQDATFDVTIDPPALPYQSNLSIAVDASGYIWNGDRYSVSGRRNVTITPYIVARKTVAPVELTLRESASVTITVKNLGDENVEILLADALPHGFETDVATEWTFSLAPMQSQNITYEMSPEEVGKFEIPVCTAEYGEESEYSVSSSPGNENENENENETEITVHGAAILAVKTIEDTLDERTKKVIVRIENVGDSAADVNATDEIPPGIVLISGETEWQERILPNETCNHSYIIQFEDMVMLPRAAVSFVDDYGNRGTVESNTVGSGTGADAGAEGGIAPEDCAPSQAQSETMNCGGLIILLISTFILFTCIFLMPAIAGYLLLRESG